jgi:hypothetical protein
MGFCAGTPYVGDELRQTILALLTGGGDDRISIGADGRNRYFATATPFSGLGYGSSTISSISEDALAHLERDWHSIGAHCSAVTYAQALDAMRARLRRHYAERDTAVVFAASGTDLEYVGLAAAPQGAGPHRAILLGRDEVGSGCIHSAAGRFFSSRTATGYAVDCAAPIDARHGIIALDDVAIRDADGLPRTSSAVTADVVRLADAALAAGQHPVIHIVHGSKTGLTLPTLGDCRMVADRYRDRVTLVVDACQLRISPAATRAYLAMGAVVLATGSKFAGGAPFSGFAFVPRNIMRRSAALSPGFAKLSRRAEWPINWPGRDILPDTANPGLLLRLAGALFEIDRFMALPRTRVGEIVTDFQAAVPRAAHAAGLAVLPGASPCLAASLATLDLSTARPDLDYDHAAAIHRALCLAPARPGTAPMRVGQPVRVRKLANGKFSATLRLSLSMPLVTTLAALPRVSAKEQLDCDLAQITHAIAREVGQVAPLRNAA